MNPELQQLKNTALVFDIETSSHYSDGKEVSIRADFDNYVELAIVKWFGAYSYKHNKGYSLNAITDRDKIITLLEEHDILVGFNNEDFDYPILENNGFIAERKKYLHVDCMVILGTANRKTKAGYPYKNRGMQMDYKFKNNSLRHIAKVMGVETQKGEIDYAIFHKNSWTEEETEEIKKYLKADVMATMQIFNKLWDFWLPFTEFIDEKYVYDLSWIRNSIASLTYKSACNVLDIEPTYCDKQSSFEEMGGRVIEPKYEEARKVWYIDFASLYPHIMSMFNLFSEVDPNLYPDAYNGGALFKTRGYYDVSEWNPLSKAVAERLKERARLKKEDKSNPMVYTLKIFLNALYGVVRSSIFEKVHTPNAGWDCCLLGQQIQEFLEDMMLEFGFETIAGDTDSLFVRTDDESKNNREYVQKCLDDVIEIIKDNVPFPVDTFKIDIENYIEYIMFPFSEEPVVCTRTRSLLKEGVTEVLKEYYTEKEEDGKTIIIDKETNKVIKRGRSWVKQRIGKKKNYMYIYSEDGEMKTQITGLPIKKDNSAPLAMKIFKEVLEPQILEKCIGKFDREYITSIIDKYLKTKEALELLAVEYKVNASDTYKKESQIQAQISRGYFDGRQGVIRLIKNTKVGNAGKGMKYCTLEEAIKANLSIDDIDIEKVQNELEPFVKHVEIVKEEKVAKKTKKPTKTVKKPIIVVESVKLQEVGKTVEKLDKQVPNVLYLQKDEQKTIDWD